MNNSMNTMKSYTTIDEQIALYRERGLIVDDEEKARLFLTDVNYYRLSGYTSVLRDPETEKFPSGSRFEDLLQCYDFDMELRLLLTYVLQYVEISLRAYISNTHAEKYGSTGYIDPVSFERADKHLAFINKFKKEKEHHGWKEEFVKHHIKKYDGRFPIWAAVELLSFSELVTLYQNLKDDMKTKICTEHYGTKDIKIIEDRLRNISDLRNICAHHGRLYCREMTYDMKLTHEEKEVVGRLGAGIIAAPRTLFVYMIILKKIVKTDFYWGKFVQGFDALPKKYPFVRLERYGFPPRSSGIAEFEDIFE